MSRVCGEARLGRWCVVPMRLGCKRASSAATLGRVHHFFRNSLPVVACALGHCDEQQQQQRQRNATSREELQLPAMRAPSDSWAAPAGIVRLVICCCLAFRSAHPDGRIKRAKCTLSRARLACWPASAACLLYCTWTGTCTVALLAQLVQLAQHAQPVLGSGFGFGFGFGEKKRKGKVPGQMSGCVSQPWLVLGIRNNKLPCSSVGGQRLNSFQPLCPPPRLGPRPRPHRKARLGFAFNPSPSLQLSLARSQYACLPTSSLLLLLSLSLLSLPLSLRSVTAPPSRRRTLRLFSPPPSH